MKGKSKLTIPMTIKNKELLCLNIGTAKTEINGKKFRGFIGFSGAGLLANYDGKSYHINTKDIFQAIVDYIKKENK